MEVQLAVAPVPDSVQLVGLKVPVPLLVNATVPVGVIAVPPDASVTVTEQVVAVLIATEEGVHETVVLVDRGVTVTVVVPVLTE